MSDEKRTINIGWGSTRGIPRWVLEAIGWDEYIRAAKMPYPKVEESETKAEEARGLA